MGFFQWIKELMGGPRRRDISRLSPSEGEGADDSAAELVDVSGGPLKEHHRRLALRDRRLLPKVKSVTRAMGLTRRKKVMGKAEADRLFSGTLRTRNRKLRDLLADEEQLKRYGLPLWNTEEDLAACLGVSIKELWFFSIHRQRERQPHYVTFSILKRSGGSRLIMAPKRRLKAIQRKLLALLVEKLPVSEHAHAFRRGRSVRTGAEPHVRKRLILHLDLKDFFPSVTFARVRGMLIAYGYSYPVASTLAVLMTEAERQPVEEDGKVYHVPVGPRHCVQGAPTSPGICNSMLLRLDRRLAGLAAKHSLSYTRYADDIAFSGDVERPAAHKIRAAASRIIAEEGFLVNAEKTRLMGSGARHSVTGVVVNQTLGLSRKDRRRMRAAAHRLVKGQAGASPERTQAWLDGRIAYLHMLNPQQADAIRNLQCPTRNIH